MQRASARFKVGDVFEAECLCREVLAADGGHFEALQLLALTAARCGRLDEACALLERALVSNPRSAETHALRARLLNSLGRFEEAVANCDRSLAIKPDVPEPYVTRGVAVHQLGHIAEALADYERALAILPDFAGALCNRAVALEALGLHEEALITYDRVLALKPDLPEALTNRAAVLITLGRFDDALASCDRSLQLMPGFHETWQNRGVALARIKRYDDALASYARALAIKPDFAEALQNRGSVLRYLKLHAEAHRDFAHAFACAPELPFLQGDVLQSQLHCCNWQDYAAASLRLVAAVRAGKCACEPLNFVAVADRAEDQLRCARTWVERNYRRTSNPMWRGERYGHMRIRVAYLSADYHEHATAYLMAELFEQHDRRRFEVTGVSWGPDSSSVLRNRLVNGFEHFIDVRNMSDHEVAQWLRTQEIDVAVDLKGFTYDARLGILAQRPAPVQVTYLGFPGTLGADYVDYLVADEVVVPLEARLHYAEHVVYLPDSYQVNDGKRAIAAQIPTRAELGLPERGFVFCSFNGNYKITPAVFDVWMRLLRQVEGSVLWVLEGNTTAPSNLRREAQARGVAGERLVFAPRLPLAEHLARQQLADLFLDTLPCNAHTTASDALWAGLPVLTCLGGTFAGRVAGSLLRAVGLPELITHSLAEYEARALELATQPEALGTMKAKLAANRLTQPLFDARRFARHLEAAYVTMWERVERGESPRGFTVPAQT